MKNEFKDSPSLKHTRNRILEFLNSNNKLLILIGPLGAGKTKNLKQLISEQNQNKVKASYIEFKAAKTIDEALLKTISTGRRLWLTSIWLVFGLGIFPIWLSALIRQLPDSITLIFKEFWFLKPDQTYLIAISFLSFALLTNRFSLLFKWTQKNTLPFIKPKVIILDDLDRTSLSTNEIFHLINNYREAVTSKLIVSIGYADSKDKFAILDISYKLGSKVEELPISREINMYIARSIEPLFPFHENSSSEWIRLFTPREIFELVESSKKEYNASDSDNKKKIICFSVFLNALFRKLRFDENDLSNTSLSDSQNQFDIRPSKSDLPFSDERKYILNSFKGSTKIAFNPNRRNNFSLFINQLKLTPTDESTINNIVDNFL